MGPDLTLCDTAQCDVSPFTRASGARAHHIDHQRADDVEPFHNERFVFDNPFFFDDRVGQQEYFAGEGVLNIVRQGNNTWETNFIAVSRRSTCPISRIAAPAAANLIFLLADSSMHAHVSEMPAGTYKKAHRHVAG